MAAALPQVPQPLPSCLQPPPPLSLSDVVEQSLPSAHAHPTLSVCVRWKGGGGSCVDTASPAVPEVFWPLWQPRCEPRPPAPVVCVASLRPPALLVQSLFFSTVLCVPCHFTCTCACYSLHRCSYSRRVSSSFGNSPPPPPSPFPVHPARPILCHLRHSLPTHSRGGRLQATFTALWRALVQSFPCPPPPPFFCTLRTSGPLYGVCVGCPCVAAHLPPFVSACLSVCL